LARGPTADDDGLCAIVPRYGSLVFIRFVNYAVSAAFAIALCERIFTSIGRSGDVEKGDAMRILSLTYLAATICVVAFSVEPVSCLEAQSSDGQHQEAASDVYIEQAHGRVPAKGKSDSDVAVKPTPEAAAGSAGTGQSGAATCNSQNSSSAACYTATQQARPATR
jgi:hypothetical protein